MTETDLSQLPMLELFRLEAESQTQVLTADLLSLEQKPDAPEVLESCMRAAHSLKGAARIIGLRPAVSVTHAMEDCFVAAQRSALLLRKPLIDVLLSGVDLLMKLANATDAQAAAWSEREPHEVQDFVAALQSLSEPQASTPAPQRSEASPGSLQAGSSDVVAPAPTLIATPGTIAAPDTIGAASPSVASPSAASSSAAALPSAPAASAQLTEGERALRVTAQNFNRLLGLSAQSLVEARRLSPFAHSLLRLKRRQEQSLMALDALREVLSLHSRDERAEVALAEAQRQLFACQSLLSERLEELEAYESRVSSVAHRMYEEALSCRMRPFSDRIQAFPRMLRDLAQSLGKQARLEIVGEGTAMDRDVLEKLEAPLTHLLRNAIDHGIDPPELRRAAGKDEVGVVRLEARHWAGMLQISVSDDGQGIDVERVRQVIVERSLTDSQTAARLSEAELYEFLFLPGFTVRERVTEISGRGVGLDAVQSAVKQLRGTVRVSSRAGHGCVFELQLPLTVSLVRSLVAEVAGQPYAFPLAQVSKTLSIDRAELKTLEGRQHFEFGGQQIGVVRAEQILDGGQPRPVPPASLHVIVVRDQESSYGLIVDRFIGVRELVVHALDPRLGKIKDILSGALLDDGSPVLIVDVEDLVRSIEKLIALGSLSKLEDTSAAARDQRRKRVLVVDDSFTVRELERKLLDGGGYDVEVAVDGVDGWNAVRLGDFDLVVTDVDMPRMDGIELVRSIRKDARLRSLPVMIVSYKDRAEDKQRGLDAGADLYLAKSAFRNEGLLEAVVDLIGEARP